jgi:glycosyltransferase involved in cell wall biosynthesis
MAAVREAGRRTVTERFTWERSVDRLLELYPRA